MRRNFSDAMALAFKWEGGYSDDPADPGGATNLGITMATLEAWRGHPVTKDDVRALRRADVLPIYEHNYWNAIKADALPDGVDLIAFDIGVNSGIHRILPWLADTAPLDPVPRIKAMHARRLSFWQHLKTFARFGRGWMNRESDIFSHALALAAKAQVPVTSKSNSPDPVTHFSAGIQQLFPTPLPKPEVIPMIAPKISLSYVVSIVSSLVGLAHVSGLINLAPGTGLLPGIGLLLAAGALAALKRSKLRDLEEQQLARLTNQKIADLLLEGQDQLAAIIGNRIGASDGSAVMTSAEGLITSLTAAFQQFPASHVEAALSAAKAVSTAVQQINAVSGNTASGAALSASVGQQTADAGNDASPQANAA